MAVFFASMDALRTASITCRVTVIPHRASQRRAASPPAGEACAVIAHAPMAIPQGGAAHVRCSVGRGLCMGSRSCRLTRSVQQGTRSHLLSLGASDTNLPLAVAGHHNRAERHQLAALLHSGHAAHLPFVSCPSAKAPSVSNQPSPHQLGLVLRNSGAGGACPHVPHAERSSLLCGLASCATDPPGAEEGDGRICGWMIPLNPTVCSCR